MIEQILDIEPIAPEYFTNEALLEARDTQAQKGRWATIVAWAGAGISVASFIALLNIPPGLAQETAGTATFSWGVLSGLSFTVASDAKRDLAIARETIAKRNQYRHPDDQLV